MNRTTQRADEPHRSTTTLSLFDQALNVFDGWTDPDTGARVLRVFANNLPRVPGLWNTIYHQRRCFLDGGRKVLLHARRGLATEGKSGSYLLDLTTGEAESPFPSGYRVLDVAETGTALLANREGDAVLWDMSAEKELASIGAEGWMREGPYFLGDGRRALVSHTRGERYDHYCESHFHLLSPDEPPRIVLEAEGAWCNHVLAHPFDPELYAYDRWPCPRYDIDQVIRIRSVDGSYDEPAKLDDHAMRPGNFYGVRDHFVWTPDGKRIVSYLNRTAVDCSGEFNHFEFDWVLSALDWRTGEDYAAPYPPGRWGGHMQMTPDSKYILCCGGPGFDKLFAVSIEELRQGWNEHVICAYPQTISAGTNHDPFPYPFALPDGSGVIFTAGWPGEEYGVFLAEWPDELK
ncbi:MAG: hypothetical protein ACYDCO_11975 [Armatimonadota bacterium]